MARRLNALNRLTNDGPPNLVLRCGACGSKTFRDRSLKSEMVGLYLLTSDGPIHQSLANRTHPPLDDLVVCTQCGLEYSKDCPWDPS